MRTHMYMRQCARLLLYTAFLSARVLKNKLKQAEKKLNRRGSALAYVYCLIKVRLMFCFKDI